MTADQTDRAVDPAKPEVGEEIDRAMQDVEDAFAVGQKGYGVASIVGQPRKRYAGTWSQCTHGEFAGVAIFEIVGSKQDIFGGVGYPNAERGVVVAIGRS